MDLKIIGLSALVNAALTIVLSIIFFPLLVLGPLTGGFLASYLSKGYEDYDKMDEKDGMVVGAISGLIGGLIIGLLSILGIGDIIGTLGVIYTDNTLINAYIIIQLSLIISFILGLVGGVIGVLIKK
jgi:hypothetical protein